MIVDILASLTDLQREAVLALCQPYHQECARCERGDYPWRPQGQTYLLHSGTGYGGRCADPLTQDLVDMGILRVVTFPPCPAGHDWYGDGCPDCDDEDRS